MLSQKMSIENKIIQLLLEPKYKYKGIPVSIFGIPDFFGYGNYKRQSISNALYRLRKNECLYQEGEYIKLLPRGRKYIENKKSRLMTFDVDFKKDAPKNLLVMFDISEGQKAEREWFRFHLKKFGYVMIQRSVWVGPSPLPKDFLDYVKSLHLKDCVKTFKLAKGYHTQT